MELLDIVDLSGEPTGQTVSRDEAHIKGIRHRTSHVWIFRRRGDTVQVLLQRRSHCKDICPDCWDISSAGHIPAGCGFTESALRELHEELGIDALPQQLLDCGNMNFRNSYTQRLTTLHDSQVSKIFVMWYDIDPSTLTLQGEEVSDARWFDWSQCLEMAHSGEPQNCLLESELALLDEIIKKNKKN